MSRLMITPTKWHVRPAKTQISLGICPVWSEYSLSAWRKLGSLATHWAHSEDSDPTGRMPKLIWVVAERELILLVLQCHGSNTYLYMGLDHSSYNLGCKTLSGFRQRGNLRYKRRISVWNRYHQKWRPGIHQMWNYLHLGTNPVQLYMKTETI